MTVTVFVSIGSNIEREKNIRLGVVELETTFGVLVLSSVYQSHAVGFSGDDFFNMVVSFETEQPVKQVASTLRDIERKYGRLRDCAKFSSRSLDLDILLFGEQDLRAQGMDIPRAEIESNAHVLQPLAELAPQSKHPLTGASYQQLWAQFNTPEQQLWVVPFSWE